MFNRGQKSIINTMTNKPIDAKQANKRFTPFGQSIKNTRHISFTPPPVSRIPYKHKHVNNSTQVTAPPLAN